MLWYHYLALVTSVFCLTSCAYHVFRLLKLGGPRDFSRRAGNVRSAVAYSFMGAMSPTKKESASLHLPTYAAGLLYHLGTFLALVLFVLFLLRMDLEGSARWPAAGALAVSVVSGAGMLLKRISLSKLRLLSSPDDYMSNILVTAFQFVTLLRLASDGFSTAYFLTTTALLLYIPLGKLKHFIYFFAARYHLGQFYGWRGSWPARKS